MRGLIYIFISVAMLSFFFGCDPVDMTEVEPAGMGLVDEVFFNVVTPFNRVAELSDFYYRYMFGYDNEDFVSALTVEYFGESVSFEGAGDDSIEVEWWGTVGPSGDDGVYIVTLDSHWMGLSPTYTVASTGSRSYHIDYNSEENNALTAEKDYALELEADIHIEGDSAYADKFRFTYEDILRGFNAQVRTGQDDEMVTFNLCRDGEYMPYPVSGVLYWAVSGADMRNFKVVFYGSYFELIEAEEMSSGVTTL